jgi:hypothetical protein
MWERGQSIRSIARALRTTDKKIAELLDGLGFVERAQRGERHHNWRGGRQITSQGYVGVRIAEDDPMASMRDRRGYVLEHRLVMARALGRPLTKDESVHHIDGVRQHNVLSNLQLRLGSHNKGVALRCRACGSHDIEAVPLGASAHRGKKGVA